MRYYGEFATQASKVGRVEIVTNNSTAKEVEIGTDGVFFTADPVSIESSSDSTFDVLRPHTATISLLVESFQPELFCKSALDARVNIFYDGVCVFAGFVEPLAYSQDYNESQDALQLSCIDALSALQYANYKMIGQGSDFRLAKMDAGQRTFLELLNEALEYVYNGLDLSGENTNAPIWYDGSKAMDARSDAYKVFGQISINDLLFLGEDADDVWTYQDILQEILKYFNLHITQIGLHFYVYDWSTMNECRETNWQRVDGVTGTEKKTPAEVTLRNEIASDTDAKLTVGEVFNKFELTASVESMDAVIESPLDDDLLQNAFSSKQLYMTEYSSDGEGDTAYNAFKNMILGNSTDWEYAIKHLWYAQVKQNSSWVFSGGGVADIYEKYCGENRNQQNMLNALRGSMGAAIISFGSVEIKLNKEDNSPISSVDMENGMYISVNGNEDDTESGYYPNADDIKAAIPIASYTGSTTGGVFSPPDDDATNYIVISGKMILNPIMHRTDNMAALVKVFNGGSLSDESESDDATSYAYSKFGYYHRTVPSQDNEDGRYYAQEVYKAETPRTEATADRTQRYPLTPFTGKGPEQYQFTYSAIGESSDTISKVPVLCCMLIIGNKCVVELGMDGTAQTESNLGKFVWQDYKEREECADDDEYYAQSFTIGIDPKKNDYLIGTEFDIQNNIDYTMGVDTEGTAIPITRGDHVSGAVKFKILGIVNLTWDVITRKHPTFFRHTSWSSTSVPLMAHVSSVILKSFEMKVYSDNGLEDSGEDNDYVYVSETDDTYYNKKDDLEFKITSALTTAEALEMGVQNSVAYSTPQDARTGDAVITIYDTKKKETAKAEQLYVDAYYTEYHTPKVALEQGVLLGNKLGVAPNELWRTLFYHPAIDKKFYHIGASFNLMEDSAKINMKEVYSA